MKIKYTEKYDLIGTKTVQDDEGYETTVDDAVIGTIDADIQSNISEKQIQLYGTRINNIFNMYSNQKIDDTSIILIENKKYKIISIKPYKKTLPAHYKYEIEEVK